ncbi:MAG: LPXTG cell wall anchor domain-containing protein [Oscillospiraceae bacterium]|nr:LPXTG cell wall anchor domain-containing protein [Oscillospiraceae bacterium]
MKRLMCLLLALVMVFSLVGVSAFAEETDADDTDPAADVEETDADAETEGDENTDSGIMLLSEENDDKDDGMVLITVTGDLDGVYSLGDCDATEVKVDERYWICVKSGYDIEVTGAMLNYDIYYMNSDEGTVYRYRDFIVDGNATEVTVKIVSSDDEAPTIVKVTTVLPEGVTESDVYYVYGPAEYILSTDQANFTLTKGYEATVTGGELLLSTSDGDYVRYAVSPDTGASEITITITKKAGGTLAVTGESDQLVSVVDADGNTLKAGDFVESDAYVYVTVNKGYVITGGEQWYRRYDSDTGASTYVATVSDVVADGTVTANIEQGITVEIAGNIYGYDDSSMLEYQTYTVGESIYVYAMPGYVAEFSGVNVNVTESYYVSSDDYGSQVGVHYECTPTSAGTLTVTFREAEDGELPERIEVKYVDEYDAITNSYPYVLPGNLLSVSLSAGYTVEVTGATTTSISASERRSSWYGIVNEDATAVTVTVVPIEDDAVLKVVDENGADASDVVVEMKWEDADSVAAGDTLVSGSNYLCLENGYEIASVEGAVWYEIGYSMSGDGTIYVEYALIPTGNPAEVTVTVVEKATLVDVTIVNNGIYAAISYYAEKISYTEYTVLSTNEMFVQVPSGYTVRVTGGAVNVENSIASSDYINYCIRPTDEAMTIEIISLEEMAEILGVDVSELGDTIALDSPNDPAQQTELDDQPDDKPDDQPDDKPDDQPDDKPDDKPDSKPDAKPDGDPGDKGGASGEKAPDTGDETNVTLWAALVAVFAASAGAVLTVLKKKEN